MFKKIDLEKLIMRILAPSTICYRELGQSFSELKYCSWHVAKFVFPFEEVGKDGYFKAIYLNNKRLKAWSIIPRHAFMEIRQKPQIKAIATWAWVAAFATAIGVSATTAAWIVVGVAAVAVGAGAMALSKVGARGISSGTGTPTYSSNDSPSLSGAKNETTTGIVPISFGRSLQVFNYAQFAIPLVNSGYGGNRYRVYCIPGYKNARYEDFKLGDILLSNYRTAVYSLQQSNGGSGFIGWDNAVTESFNKELSFDTTQAVFQSAIAYYNQSVSGTTLAIEQTYNLQGVDLAHWTDKTMGVTATFVSGGADVTVSTQTTILLSDLVPDGLGGYNALKTIVIDLGPYSISEYRYTTTSPNSTTRGNNYEANLEIDLITEEITVGSGNYSDSVNQGVNSYTGDKNEIISQSPTETQYCDMHFSFPQGLYTIDAGTGARARVTIQAEVYWKKVGDTSWSGLSDSDIVNIYTRDLDGVVQTLSSRITRSGDLLTFKTPDDINNADDNFFECVGLEFAETGQYIVKVLPVTFVKDSYWVGTINIADIIWRLASSMDVVDETILPNVSQVACTFNATTQLDGEVDALGAIAKPFVLNLKTEELEQSRNPVDIIYYLLTDIYSNPDPMLPSQLDMDSFLSARQWCEDHDCYADGVISDEVKYEMVINEIASNNQLYFIPNKWGKAVLRVDTNEDSRPIKTFFNAENSWGLSLSRQRGSLNRLLALRCSYIDEETWSEQEITGYWYNSTCNFVPESGKDDTYYKPEKRDLQYVKNANNVKRRIAYELEVANTKNVQATFNVAREVLDLEVLDRVLLADYTRINEGISGVIGGVIQEGVNIIGVRLDSPIVVTTGMTITVRSIDLAGNGANVQTLALTANSASKSSIYFSTPILASTNIIRGSGFYDVDGTDFYHSGDIYMVGTANILSMVISNIEEIKGDDFTSKITCRLY